MASNLQQLLLQHSLEQQDLDRQRARKFKSLVEYADSSKLLSKDKAMTMDVDSLEGLVQGAMAKQEMDKNAATLQAFQDKSNEDNWLANLGQQLAPMLAGQRPAIPQQTASATMGLASLFTGIPELDTNGAGMSALAQYGQPMSPQEKQAAIWNAVAAAGKANPHAAAAFLKPMLQTVTGSDTGTPTFTTSPGGMILATYGKNMQPAGVDPSVISTGLQAQHDDEGNLIGYTSTDIRGHSTFHLAKGGNKLKPARDSETGLPIQGFYLTPEGKTVDTRGALQKLGVDVPAPAPAAAAPAETAASAPPTVTPAPAPAAAVARVSVWDDAGNRYSIPDTAAQRALAKQRGMSFTKVEKKK